MELNEYQDKAMTTCTESSDNLSYMLLNLVGEVGEFASKIAKSIRTEQIVITDNDMFSKKGYDPDLCTPAYEALKLEASDILWQLSGLCKTMGWTLEEVAQANLDKLASRKDRGVIVGDGDHR